MLTITQRLSVAKKIDDYLELPFELRQKSRLRTRLKSGIEAILLLDRGIILRNGDLLHADSGQVVQIVASPEPLYQVTATQTLDLMRAAYHLGNRHIPLQVSVDALYLEADSVLKTMLLGLGVRVQAILAPFEPEAGAYGGGHRHASATPSGFNLKQPVRLKHG